MGIRQSWASFTSPGWVATTRRILGRSISWVFPLAVLAATLAPEGAGAQGSEVARVLDVPGLDFSRLPAPAKKELAAVFTDEFDYCGRPMTIAASLKKDPCRHTRRLAQFAGVMAAEGLASNEIIIALSRYNQTFTARRHTFKTDEKMCKGPADARITIVEFSDFECPYCNAVRPMLADVLKRRRDVRLCYLPFPLPGHANALPATGAALFARDAGKFWAMHDALFDHQSTLSLELIKSLAAKQGLDAAAVHKAIADNKYQDEINASRDAGKAAGVDATPMLYLNGRKLTLNPTPEALSVAIDDELDWAAGKSAWPSN